MGRLVALIILVIPGILAGYGIKMMRDMLFGILLHPYPNLSIQFLLGLVFFVAGLSFIAGFIFRRDQKRNKVQKRFIRKKNE
ncbi:DUF2627 domain-containing protein [Bacillus chungangensis]|uniref:Transporter YbjL n=1 Tax=Bacillus chungangensis TaxID=587633 RepID=A0ABT9WPI5_9BACI|nr:DUF2627 domain-containing protein [Bacillus chungangensis]MDQ0175122.1 putative transporter YbjL [Bacillus chungangensis]